MTQTEEYTDLFAAFGEQQDNARVIELMKIIRYHRDLYYNGHPEIEDDEFDALVDELKDLDPTNVVLNEVGAPVADDSNWEKASHNIPMTSLDKVNTIEELQKWGKTRYVRWYNVQEKLDGGSVSADYVDGKLVQVLTRGRGAEGEIITRNAVNFQGVKRRLPTKFTGSLRGEVMFFANDFAAYNEAARKNGWRVYKNMRNGANGLARRTNGNGVKHLRVLFYEIVGNVSFGSHFEKMNYIRKRLGLWTPWYARVQFPGLVRIYKEYSSSKRENLPYEIDGLVIKVDSHDEAETIEDTLQKSNRATANPKSQVALKFASETRVTTILAIAADFGLGGTVTPVAEVEPVKIGGVTVSRASIHNWPMVEALNIKVGGKVLIKRANDVIPQVVRMLDDVGTSVAVPTHCPKCNQPLEARHKAIRCGNNDCHGVISGQIRNWVNKIGVKHFGMSTLIEPLVAAGKLRTVADLYKLDEADIGPMVGKGYAKKGLANLLKKLDIELHILVGSIGIDDFGRGRAELLTKAGYDTLDKLLTVQIPDMTKVAGIGTGIATAAYTGLRLNEALLRELLTVLVVKAPRVAVQGGILQGKTFCITGSLTQKKAVYEDMILNNGGGYETSLKSNVTHLIAADPGGNSSKLQKARKKGTQVIGEDDLRKLISG